MMSAQFPQSVVIKPATLGGKLLVEKESLSTYVILWLIGVQCHMPSRKGNISSPVCDHISWPTQSTTYFNIVLELNNVDKPLMNDCPFLSTFLSRKPVFDFVTA